MQEDWVFTFVLKESKYMFIKSLTETEAMNVAILVNNTLMVENRPLRVETVTVYPVDFVTLTIYRLSTHLQIEYFNSASVFN